MTSDQEKELAARASLQFVRDGDVVGLGSGSTAAYAIRYLGERVRAGMKIRGIATSVQTQNLAASVGIPLTTLEDVRRINVTIDRADELCAVTVSPLSESIDMPWKGSRTTLTSLQK